MSRKLPAPLTLLLQPLLLVFVLGAWLMDPEEPGTYVLMLFTVQVVLGTLEHFFPARPEWRQSGREKLRNIAIVLVVGTGTISVGGWYGEVLAAPLAAAREAAGLDVWPHGWPLLVQMVMIFLASEFIWYWLHRAEHRWPIVWRASGHGAHHSFKHLGAINFGANHPLEIFLLVLPAALVELFFGVGAAAAGAAILLVIQASIAHANLTLNSRIIGWVLTTNEYHIRHHSVVLEESNTNYGCAVILWDRVFGTFASGPTAETGTGATEPTLWEKFLMPLREPADTAIAPGQSKAVSTES